MPYERRHFIRVEFDAPARLIVGDAAFPVMVIDLSLKGALVQMPRGIQVSTSAPCKLCVPLNGDLVEISMDMQVAYVDGHVLGLECTHSDIDSVTHLRRLIELQLGDPALLERDLYELMMQSGH